MTSIETLGRKGKMNAEQMYQLIQIKPGPAPIVHIDPQDPKDTRTIQAILKEHDRNRQEIRGRRGDKAPAQEGRWIG